MSTETRPRADAPPELDAEQEVDFGRYWRTIIARWWLLLAGLVGGLLIGYLVALGTSTTVYKATAQVYLGQQIAPSSAVVISSAPTSLGLVAHFVTSESTVRQAAAAAGLKVGRLRGHVSTKPILGVTTGRLGTPAPLIAITVESSPRAKVAKAANVLAGLVVEEVSGYTDVKIQALEDQLAFDERELASVVSRIESTRAQQQDLLTERGLGAAEKLIASVNFNNLLTFLESRQASLERDRLEVRQFLSLAEDVERARIVAPAAAAKTASTSSRTGAAVGGLIGLILGVIAALIWDPVAARRAREPSES